MATNRVEALKVIAKEARAERGSRTSMLRLEKALKSLGLNEKEVGDLMRYFDYWHYDTGEPYPLYAPKEKAV